MYQVDFTDILTDITRVAISQKLACAKKRTGWLHQGDETPEIRKLSKPVKTHEKKLIESTKPCLFIPLLALRVDYRRVV